MGGPESDREYCCYPITFRPAWAGERPDKASPSREQRPVRASASPPGRERERSAAPSRRASIHVRIHYPKVLEDKARRVATAFRHPEVEVELVPDSIDGIVIEGPSFATTDITRATALVRRYLLG